MRLEIVHLLAKNKEKKFTINELAKALGKYYSFVHKSVNKLSEEGIIIKIKAGRSYLCSLDFGNEKTLTMIQLSEIQKREKFYSANKELKLILEDFVKSAESKIKDIVTIVLFGSYAKGTETKDSDIDILVINSCKNSVEKITKEIYAKYGKEIIPIALSKKEFEKQKDKALIREIIKTHYVLYGVEKFVSLVFKK
jgi:predicted nucleotidyltransferase/biotin operon repressor